MRYYVTFPDGAEVPVDLTFLEGGGVRAEVERRALHVDMTEHGRALHMLVDGRAIELWMEGSPPEVGVIASGYRVDVKAQSDRMRAQSAASGSRGGRGE